VDNHLDQYITSEIFKQFKGSLEVASEPSRADAIPQRRQSQRSKHHPSHAEPRRPRRQNRALVRHRGDRDANFLDIKHGGLQIVPAHLVKDLKKAMQSK
jgi:hypothetical protein